jgi:hypothetical protein
MVRRLIPLALVLTVPLEVQADVAPEPYVETCTLEGMSFEHRSCEVCRASLREPDVCAARHAAAGRQQACRSGGATVWTEVWCLPDEVTNTTQAGSARESPAQESPAQESPAQESPQETAPSCSARSRGASARPWVAVALLLVTASRRRRHARG